MKNLKTVLRLIVICVAGFAGVFLSQIIVPAVATFFPNDPVGPPEWYASLIGGVTTSLLACLLLIPIAGVPRRRRILAVVLSPLIAAAGIALYWSVTSRMKIEHPYEGWIFLILWALVIPLSTYLGYRLPLRASRQTE